MEHEEAIYSDYYKIEQLYKYEKIVMHHMKPNDEKLPRSVSELSWEKFIESVMLVLPRV